jgi:hypothetical protein
LSPPTTPEIQVPTRGSSHNMHTPDHSDRRSSRELVEKKKRRKTGVGEKKRRLPLESPKDTVILEELPCIPLEIVQLVLPVLHVPQMDVIFVEDGEPSAWELEMGSMFDLMTGGK